MDAAMALLLLLHVVAAAAMPAATARWGAKAFLLGATAPGTAAVWGAFRFREVVTDSVVRETLTWAPQLGLDVQLRLDALALVMVALVSGIGCVVLVYSAWYFGVSGASPSAGDGHTSEGARGNAVEEHTGGAADDTTTPGEHTGRAALVLVVFAGAMLGLVLADNLLVLYVFWELTTVCSFLLIGHDDTPAAHRAALRALFVTTGFGLFMLLGFVLLGTAAGTYRISELVAGPVPESGAVRAGLVLVLVGAFAKSAQVPLHFWLPDAMVAPAPVSAYLHAAAMVKAGVYLVARLAPGFAELAPWRPLVLTVGLATLLAGAWWALAQTDLKRLLAFGTVSQLGLLLVLAGTGTRIAATAAEAMLLAHGLFKAALFLSVGVLEKQAGSYQADELSGVGRAMPVLYGASILAGLSMAGVPPVLGFVGKEAALEAFVHGMPIVLAGVAAGSVLTVAYTLRLLRAGFGTRPDRPPTEVAPAAPGLVVPVCLLALAGLLAVPFLGTVQALVRPYARTLPGEAYRLALWHGLTPALGLSALILMAGLVVHLGERPIARLRTSVAARLPDARRLPELSGRALQGVALAVTRTIQVGSLPAYLAIILGTLVLLPGSALVMTLAGIAERPEHRWPGLRWWATPVQLALGALILATAFGATRANRRLDAVVLLAATGFGLGGLYVVHGAPDVALTHVLVETLLLIMLALVLRRLPETFSEPGRRRAQQSYGFGGLAAVVGVFLGLFVVLAQGATGRARVGEAYLEQAPEVGGANAVDVILVDFRALDTLGEITVLAVTITGVVGLIGSARRRRIRHGGRGAGRETGPGTGQRIRRRIEREAVGRGFLSSGARPPLGRRSLVLEASARVLAPVVLVFSVYLLLAAHDRPGGGFAGGLVAGMAYVLRYVAGGRTELRASLPARPALFIGGGLFLATLTGAAGWFWAGSLLGSAKAELTLPVVGHLELSSTLLFEFGVYLLVLGLILALLATLGAALEQHEGMQDERVGV